MYCTECGTKNQPASSFCIECGNKLTITAVVVSSKVSETANATLKKLKQDSSSAELLRWHELYLRGVLAEEEFMQKKRELL